MSDKQKADYFYNVEDWDLTYHDLDTLMDAADPDRYGIVEVGRLVEIERVYVVKLPDPDDSDCDAWQEFATRENAQAAIEVAKAKEAGAVA